MMEKQDIIWWIVGGIVLLIILTKLGEIDISLFSSAKEVAQSGGGPASEYAVRIW